MSGIKAGDLVMVVRATLCCGNAAKVGVVFRCLEVGKGPYRCLYCGGMATGVYADRYARGGYNVARLIRIDPPALPESVETDREVVA